MMDLECACAGPPPPPFRVPPPPRPPFLPDIAGSSACSDTSIHSCEMLPMLDGHWQGSHAIYSLIIIVVSSLLLLSVAVIASVLVWKYKRKPERREASGKSLDDAAVAAEAVYEDIGHFRPRRAPANHYIHSLQVKESENCRKHRRDQEQPMFISSLSRDTYSHVYQEISLEAPERGPLSEDELSMEEAPRAPTPDVCRRWPPAPRRHLQQHAGPLPAPYECVPLPAIGRAPPHSAHFATFRPLPATPKHRGTCDRRARPDLPPPW